MHDVIKDISDFIFVADAPERADILFIPGGSYPELPEHAAKLWREGFAPLVLPTGKYSVKRGRFRGVHTKADVYDGDYLTECEFMTDVLRKNGVPAAAILREDRSEYTRQNAFFCPGGHGHRQAARRPGDGRAGAVRLPTDRRHQKRFAYETKK